MATYYEIAEDVKRRLIRSASADSFATKAYITESIVRTSSTYQTAKDIGRFLRGLRDDSTNLPLTPEQLDHIYDLTADSLGIQDGRAVKGIVEAAQNDDFDEFVDLVMQIIR